MAIPACTASATYTGSFTIGQSPSAQAQQDWVNFRQSLVPADYDTVTISGSNDATGRTLTDATIVPQIATAMKTQTAGSWTVGSITWTVGIDCSYESLCPHNGQVELTASTNGERACYCDSSGGADYTVRPEICNENWGGVNTATCSAPTQTMTVTFSGAPSCAPQPSNMVSWWPGDGNFHDIQGDNDGSTTTGVTFTTGEVNQAFDFQGSSYVSVPNASNLSITGDITIDAWVRPTANNGFMHVVSKRDFDNSSVTYELFRNGNETMGFASRNSGFNTSANSGFTVPLDTWSHVAVVISGSTITFYLNGVADAPQSYGFARPGTSDVLTIGDAHGSFGDVEFWTGQLDEIELFNRALTDVEILSIYAAGCTGKCRSCARAPAGMIGWWPGNGSAEDVQGSNDGTVNGVVTFDPGKVGLAFGFNGNDAANYVDIGNPADLKPTQGITLDAWIYMYGPPDWDGLAGIITKWGQGPNDNWAIWALQTGSGIELLSYVVTTSGQSGLAGGSISIGEWTHVALTYDATSGTHTLYINGVSVATTQLPPGSTLLQTDGEVCIGRECTYQQRPFNGLIDEVEVFARGLTPQEIESIYDAGSAGKCPCVTPPLNMAAWWPGDGNPYDIQGGNTGTLQGNTTFASGEVSQAFSFDGDGDYVEVPNDDSLNPLTLTVDTWIYPTDTNGNHNVVFKGDHEYLLQIRNGNVLFGSRDSAANYAEFQGSLTVPANTWSHVAITHDGTTKKIYVNGVLDPNTQSQTGLYTGDTNPLKIGTHHFVVEFFSGLIDEVEIFSRALSQSEIQDIYHAAGAGKCKPPDSDHDGDPDFLDCDDSNPNVHHGATEICNGIDDNCDGQIDEGFPDSDGDGTADCVDSCPNDPNKIAPGFCGCGNPETDTDGDGTPDCIDGCPNDPTKTAPVTFYRDADGDGYGNPNNSTPACSQPAGYVANNTDCNDSNANIHPGATETCNGVDDNCNGQIDEGLPRVTISRVVVQPVTAREGQTTTFSVSISKPASQPATVYYSMSGSAMFGSDYNLSGVYGQVTIPAGKTSGTVTLRALVDHKKENNETATMTLQPGGCYTLPSQANLKSATATIPANNL